jgi:tRNA (guanine-N7-)-methyltransferase
MVILRVLDLSTVPGIGVSLSCLGLQTEGRKNIMRRMNDGLPSYALLEGTRYHRLRASKANVLLRLLPQVAIDLTQPVPGNIRSLFPVSVTQVHLEIGFGCGEHLLAEAIRNPDTGFICSDTYLSGIIKVLKMIERENIKNIRIYLGDATELLKWIPDDCITRIDLLFPDPWRKRKHHKRRFVRDDMLSTLARAMRADAEFRFASDSFDYVTWAVTCFQKSSDFRWAANTLEDCRQPWSHFPGTKYEAKAQSEGRQAYYLTFQRVQSTEAKNANPHEAATT